MQVDPVVLALVSKPEYANLSDDEAAAVANTASVKKTDSTLKKSRAITLQIGIVKAQQLYTAIKNAGFDIIQGMLNDDGIDFSSTTTQGMIDKFVHDGEFSAEDGNAMKAIGIWYVTPYHDGGGTGTATAESFTAARLYASLRLHASARYNEAVDAIEAGTVADLAALKTILGA